MSGAWRATWRRANPGWDWLLLVLPVLGQAADLSGWLSSDPLHIMTGLSRLIWLTDGVLPGLPWIDPNAGATLQTLGGAAASQWLSGEVPWWNHYSGVGLPLAGEMQPAVFFLPFILLLRLPHGMVLLKISLQILAGLATWRLLRRLQVGPAASVLGGILFQFNGTFAWFGDVPQLPVPFLPLLLLGIERARQTPGPAWRSWWLVAVALAWSLFAGFPETAYLDGLLAAAWSVLRLVQGPERLRLLLRLAAGVLSGLALAAPALLPFFQLMGQAWLGDHGGPDWFLVPSNWAMLLFPHAFGAPLYGLTTGANDSTYWWNMGGYLPVTLLLAALLGAAVPGPERGLRAMLAGWVALVLARAGGVPGIVPLFNLIPLIHDSFFFRYVAAAWELPCCVLAAFACDLRRGVPRLAVGVALSVCGIAAAAAGLAAWPELHRLIAARPAAVAYPVLAAAWGLGGLALLGAGFARRARWPGLVLAVDAMALFMVPTLAGTRDRVVHDGIVAYLRAHLGLQRAYGLGRLIPNYGAWFGVATINHQYLPVPSIWSDYVRDRLDPGTSLISFSGASPVRPGEESRAEALRRRRDAYAATGVSLVLAPSGTDPFQDTTDIHPSGAAVARPVSAAEPLMLQVPASLLKPGMVTAFGIESATYAGSADGRATLQICSGADCRTAERALQAVPDGTMLTFALNPALPAGGPAPLVTLGQVGAAHPFAVWLHGGLPTLALTYASAQPLPPLVYADSAVDAYALADPAPYFEADPNCVVVPIDWRAVRLRCARPGRLIRRELSYPGWRVSIDHERQPVGADGIFQTVQVPAGDHVVRFRYAPPGIGLAWMLATAGLGAILLSLRSRLSRRRPPSASLS